MKGAEMEELFYTMKEVGQQTGLSADTIRYYEKIGLLPRITRNQAGVRQFSLQDLAILEFIGHFKSVGMSLDKLKAYMDLVKLGDESIPERIAILKAERLVLEQRLSAISEAIRILDVKISNYDQTLAKYEKEVFGQS
jgi:DNA-binding transcriptional MerR regulator